MKFKYVYSKWDLIKEFMELQVVLLCYKWPKKNSFKHGLVLTHEKEKGVLFGLRVIMICSYQLCFSLKSANDLN